MSDTHFEFDKEKFQQTTDAMCQAISNLGISAAEAAHNLATFFNHPEVREVMTAFDKGYRLRYGKSPDGTNE